MAVTPPQVISFARGVPAPECLAVDDLADCARTVIERDGRTVLSYGSGAGYTPLRSLIGEWFGVAPSRVVLTNGSLNGFVLLAQRLGRGQNAIVEHPTYDRAIKILLGAGAPPPSVPPGLAPRSTVHGFFPRGLSEPTRRRWNALLRAGRAPVPAAPKKNSGGAPGSRPEGGSYIGRELPAGTIAKDVIAR